MSLLVVAAFYEFTQQNLPACKPVLTPAAVSSLTVFKYSVMLLFLIMTC